jgi:RHS repeat-associated protein
MIRSHRSLLGTLFLSLLPYFVASLLPLCASAQTLPATGTPPFGSFGGGPDVINLANLNAHWNIPVINKPGRGGMNFTYNLSYDSSVWSPTSSSGTYSWTPGYDWGWTAQTAIQTGYVSYSMNEYMCDVQGPPWPQYYIFDSFVYYDPWGGKHSFRGSMEYDPTLCDQGNHSSMGSTATDGSGLSLGATLHGYTVNASIIKTNGQVTNPPLNGFSGSTTATDRNGNQITSDGSGHFYDTLSSTTPVLTYAGSGTPASPNTFTYTAPSGSASYTMKYTAYTVQTSFGCSGVSEYGPTSNNLVSEIDLPDGVSKYTFTYETTPNDTHNPHYVTGRIASVTLPTGGTISYTYTGGSSGHITCSDGSAAGLTRQTPDGTWTYARTMGTAAASATLITAPKLPYDSASNQTILQFQGIYPTQSDAYQGTAPTFSSVPISESTLQTASLLQEARTCYNASAIPCTSTTVTLPITQRTVTSSVPGPSNLWAQHTDKFNSYGLQTESDDYDFSATPPGTRLQQTTITYATLGDYLTSFPQTVEVLNSAGVIQSRQDTAYDGATLTCVTGVTQHNDTNYPCTLTTRGNATSVTTYTSPSVPSGGITKNFTYNSLGDLLTAQVNCCQQETWTYSTTTAYAFPDSVTTGTSAPQLTTSMTYDLNMGLMLTSTDPNSLKTTLTYDNMGRPLTSTVGSNPATTYTYNDSGTWTAQVCSPVQGTNTGCQKTIDDSQGRGVTTQLLDAGSNLYSATDTQYDPWGRSYKVSNPYTTSASYWTQTNFDALGRATKITLQDSSVSTTSYSDNTVTATDPAGKQRKGVSDALGHLTSVYEPDPTNNNSLTLQTSYSYNVFNQLIQVTQGSQTRTYVYDALGRLNSSTTPETGMVCFGTLSGSTCQSNGYDSWNNLLYRTDARGVVTNYLYDTLNRLVGISYPTVPSGVSPMPNVCKVNGATSNNANVCLVYGASASSYNNGLNVSMTDATGSESYTYNSQEQVTQLQKVIGSNTYTTSYSYNLAGELTQITYPSGRVVAQSFDAIGRLCAVGTSGSTCSSGTTYATGFAYNAAQQITGLNYGNGVAANLGYSPDRLQLNSLSYAKSGTTLFGLSYTYGTSGSNDGLISAVTDNVQAGRSVSYTYDSLSRLSTSLTTGSSTYPQWGLSWTYDRYANPTAETQTAGTPPHYTLTVSPSTNQISGSAVAYDVAGNMTNDGINTLVYDGENRAVSATVAGTSSGTYTYDGKGLRIQKVSVISGTSTTTVYIFSGSKVIAEYDNGVAPTAPSREYVYSRDSVVSKIDSSGTHYYHKDLVSNRLVTDSSGNVAEQLGHYPYGESWYNSSNDKLLFTSYERDAESGNDYAQARYYISRLGRFSSPDLLSGTIANPQSLNRYTYVLNSPTSLVDPTGMDPCDPIMIDARRRHQKKPDLTAGNFGPFDSGEVLDQDLGDEGCIDDSGGGGDPPTDGGGGNGGNVPLPSAPCPPGTICVDTYEPFPDDTPPPDDGPSPDDSIGPLDFGSGLPPNILNNPCAGISGRNLSYTAKPIVPYKDGSNTALQHIIRRHILPNATGSRYFVMNSPNPGIEIMEAIAGVELLNRITFEQSTPTVDGDTLVFEHTFQDGEPLGMANNGYLYTVVGGVGQLRNGGITFTNTLRVYKNCLNVITSFAGTVND